MDKLHLPCPCGNSGDAFTIYSDGHGYCFNGACNKRFNKEELKGMDNAGNNMHNNNDNKSNNINDINDNGFVKLPVGKLVA